MLTTIAVPCPAIFTLFRAFMVKLIIDPKLLTILSDTHFALLGLRFGISEFIFL